MDKQSSKTNKTQQNYSTNNSTNNTTNRATQKKNSYNDADTETNPTQSTNKMDSQNCKY